MRNGFLNYEAIERFEEDKLCWLCHQDPAYLYNLTYFVTKAQLKKFLKICGIKDPKSLLDGKEIPSNYHDAVDIIFEKNNFYKLINSDIVCNFAVKTIPWFYREYINQCINMKTKTRRERFLVLIGLLLLQSSKSRSKIARWYSILKALYARRAKSKKIT